MNASKIKNILYAVALAGVVGALNELLGISSSLGLEQPWPEVIALVLGWMIQEVEDLEKKDPNYVPPTNGA